MEKRILSVADLSKYLGIGLNSAYALVRKKGFPCIKVGKRILIPEFELENWLAYGALVGVTVVLGRAETKNKDHEMPWF